MRFDASVTRGVRDPDGNCQWRSSIKGRCDQLHATMTDGMARVEFELRDAGEQFVTEYKGYEASRDRNKFSRAVDAARDARELKPVRNDL